tara:strand:- start:459 stop:668 length:210 start_codon:yes stop_codon:yes gene_type:complete
MNTEKLIEQGRKVTLKAIEADLKADWWDALYYASYDQISNLVNQGRIDEDFVSRHYNYQEEMRAMLAQF